MLGKLQSIGKIALLCCWPLPFALISPAITFGVFYVNGWAVIAYIAAQDQKRGTHAGSDS